MTNLFSNSDLKTNIPNRGTAALQSAAVDSPSATQSTSPTSIMTEKTNTNTNINDEKIVITVDGINVEAILNQIVRKNNEDQDIINIKAFSELTEEQKQAVLKYLYAKNQYEFGDQGNKKQWSDLKPDEQIAKLEATKLPAIANKFFPSELLKDIIGANRLGVELNDKATTIRSIKESYGDYLIDNYLSSNDDKKYIDAELPDEDKYMVYDGEYITKLLCAGVGKKYEKYFAEHPDEQNITINVNGKEVNINRSNIYSENPILDAQTQRDYMTHLGHTSLDYAIKAKENRLDKGYYKPGEEQKLDLEIKILEGYSKTEINDSDITPINDILTEEQLGKWNSLADGTMKERLELLKDITSTLREKFKDNPEQFAKAIRDVSCQLDNNKKSEVGYLFAKQVLCNPDNSKEVFEALAKYCYHEAKFSLDDIAAAYKLTPQRTQTVTDMVVGNGEIGEISNTISNSEAVNALDASVRRAKEEGTITEQTEIDYVSMQSQNKYISSEDRSLVGTTTREKLGEKANNYATEHAYEIQPPELAVQEYQKYLDSEETKWAASNTDAAIKAKVPSKFDKEYQTEVYNITDSAIDNNFQGKDAESRHTELIDIIQYCDKDNQQSMYENAMQSSNEAVAQYAQKAYETRYVSATNNTTTQNQTQATSTSNYQTNPISYQTQETKPQTATVSVNNTVSSAQTSKEAIEQLNLQQEADQQKLIEIISKDNTVISKLDPQAKKAVLEVYCKRLDGAQIFALFKKNPSLYSYLLKFSGEKLNLYKDQMFKILSNGSVVNMEKLAKELGIDLIKFAKQNKEFAAKVAITTKNVDFANSIIRNAAFYGLQMGSSEYFDLVRLIQKKNENLKQGEFPVYNERKAEDVISKFTFKA